MLLIKDPAHTRVGVVVYASEEKPCSTSFTVYGVRLQGTAPYSNEFIVCDLAGNVIDFSELDGRRITRVLNVPAGMCLIPVHQFGWDTVQGGMAGVYVVYTPDGRILIDLAVKDGSDMYYHADDSLFWTDRWKSNGRVLEGNPQDILAAFCASANCRICDLIFVLCKS